ncbi:MAG: hypothetical protein P1P87_11905 [Trueperaceae bacterium]|nr:hypothetical protein [Trueperaceae bacterium]
MTETKRATKKTATEGFTAEEKAAMKEAAAERKRQAKSGDKREAGEKDVRAKIDEMDGHDRAIAAGLHAVVTEHAAQLAPRTWYGMPAYANADGKVVCFFQAATKFGSRYATLGFQDAAQLDDGDLWPASFAVLAWTPEVEARVVELVKRAAR